MMKRILILNILALCGLSQMAVAQPIMADRGIEANGLWCFPLVDDSLSYYYLPDEASIALDERHHPQFSLIRYVTLAEETSASANTIGQSGGGAVLHFLIEYQTSPERIAKAEAILKELLQNEKVAVKGPVIFENGRYAIISSILTQEGNTQNLMMASGSAPVLEGSKIALSFEIDPETSKLLIESLKMPTSDVSIVFDMTFSGISKAFNAEMEVDWSQVQKHSHISASSQLYFVSAEVDLLFDELRKEQAIRLTTTGEDENMEALIDRMYEKLMQLFFDPVASEKVPPAVKQDITGALSKVMSGLKKKTPFSAHGAYQLKELKTAGTSRLSFNSAATVQRHHYFSFNMGDLYQQYGDDQRFFRTVDMEDPDFRQREVYVGVDGSLIQEMGRMINNVTVTLRKQHQNGGETLREIVVTPQTLADSLIALKMIYGSKEDNDRLEWLSYDYQTNWKFAGGGSFLTPWTSETTSMINLFAPFKRTNIQLLGDEGVLVEQGVRAAIIQISYPFFDEIRIGRLTWKPGDDMDQKQMDITLPLNHDQYSYKITWVKNDGSRQVKEGDDNTGLIFIDELP